MRKKRESSAASAHIFTASNPLPSLTSRCPGRIEIIELSGTKRNIAGKRDNIEFIATAAVIAMDESIGSVEIIEINFAIVFG